MRESATTLAAMAALPKIMLGFVVRRCTIALGHAPSPAEFAHWANANDVDGEARRLFGRPITEREAALILKHPERPVSARSATRHEQGIDAPPAAPNVVSIDIAAKRRDARAGRAKPARR